eukprot:2501933-Rhodomonas_salina.1
MEQPSESHAAAVRSARSLTSVADEKFCSCSDWLVLRLLLFVSRFRRFLRTLSGEEEDDGTSKPAPTMVRGAVEERARLEGETETRDGEEEDGERKRIRSRSRKMIGNEEIEDDEDEREREVPLRSLSSSAS